MAHIFWTHILLHELQRHKLSKRQGGSAGKRILALSLFEKWYKSFTRTWHSQLHRCIDFQNFKEMLGVRGDFFFPPRRLITFLQPSISLPTDWKFQCSRKGKHHFKVYIFLLENCNFLLLLQPFVAGMQETVHIYWRNVCPWPLCSCFFPPSHLFFSTETSSEMCCERELYSSAPLL